MDVGYQPIKGTFVAARTSCIRMGAVHGIVGCKWAGEVVGACSACLDRGQGKLEQEL